MRSCPSNHTELLKSHGVRDHCLGEVVCELERELDSFLLGRMREEVEDLYVCCPREGGRGAHDMAVVSKNSS